MLSTAILRLYHPRISLYPTSLCRMAFRVSKDDLGEYIWKDILARCSDVSYCVLTTTQSWNHCTRPRSIVSLGICDKIPFRANVTTEIPSVTEIR